MREHDMRERAAATATSGSTMDFSRSHANETGRKFSEVHRLVNDAGLLDLRSARYLVKIAVNTAMLVAGVAAFILIGDSWWRLLTAQLKEIAATVLPAVRAT